MFIGYIYKITGACGGVYIGSTVNPKERSKSHRGRLLEGSTSKLLIKPLIFTIIRQDEYILVRTMRLVEQYYIDNIECVNHQRAFLGTWQKKERIRKYGIKYRETHKLKIKERDFNYRLNNQEQISLSKKKWQQNNKEKLKEYNKNWYETNKLEINKNKSIKIECQYCKTLIRKSDIARHHKTKRCLAIQKSLNLS